MDRELSTSGSVVTGQESRLPGFWHWWTNSFMCCQGEGNPVLDSTVPGLLKKMEDEHETDEALRQLCELSSVKNRHYRVPLVSSSTYDVLTPLARRLYQPERKGTHLACLTLNNLSIPIPNKKEMVIGRSSDDIIKALAHLMKEGRPESCICVICLVNLSLFQDNVVPIMHLTSSPDVANRRNLLAQQNSLLRIVENVLVSFSLPAEDVTVESETIRWTCCLVKNLAASKNNADLIVSTDIPFRLIEFIKSPRPPNHWAPDCVETASLRTICAIARWPQTRELLTKAGTVDALTPIVGTGGVNGTTASTALSFLL